MARYPQGRVSLTFMSGPLDGKTLTWDYPDNGDELVLIIGRREGCDIVLNYDSQVSRQHARVVYAPAEHAFFLEDAGSRNGTFLGSDKLKGRALLLPGALFRIGRTWLRLDPLRSAPEEIDEDITQL
jgi:pSer/pThr/pTyr-binding forkhead associated (FHA) protein